MTQPVRLVAYCLGDPRALAVKSRWEGTVVAARVKLKRLYLERCLLI